MRAFVAVAILFPAAAFGDDLLLKDGRKVPWKTLSDEGEEYLVDGKTRVKKADVDRLVVAAPPQGPPLTGATFTLDRKKARSVELCRKPLSVGPVGIGHMAVSLEHEVLPEQYDLTLLVERTRGQEDFYVGILSAGRRLTLHLDAVGGSISGLQLIDGQTFWQGAGNGTAVRGTQFQNGKPRTVRIMVRKSALVVQLDGKDFIAWKADWPRASVQDAIDIADKERIFVGAFSSAWKVSSAVLTQER